MNVAPRMLVGEAAKDLIAIKKLKEWKGGID
jgi:hypothetical protein